MSSSHPYQNPYPNSNPTTLDEQRWIIHIRRALDEDDLDQGSDDTPVSIFNVPKILILTSPQSFTPQQVALGPYHHFRPELYEMEKLKISAAKRFQNHLHGLNFHNLVDHLAKFEPKFRSCYHKYLNLNAETLAWMMAVDSCFLLEFLQSDSVSWRGRKSGHDALVRDMVMLENQIPLFSLGKVMEFQLGSMVEADDLLRNLLIGFCKEVLPFQMMQELPNVDHVVECAHLLDFLYRSIVPESEGSSEIASEAEKEEGEKIGFRNIISLIKRLVISKPVKFLLTLPWRIVSVFPGVMMMKQIEYLCFSQEREKNKPETENSDLNNLNKHPLMEEIAIPSVTELSRAGVRFLVTNEGIIGIDFDVKTGVFHLPTISLDVNTEVVMRNLVAYEACKASGPLIFTRYTELMNGIIDTEDDAKFLRERGIVLNHLKSDEDVANLWNGMSKSIRLTKVPFLDKVIEDVNSYYRGSWKVRIGKLWRRHVFGSWQSMTFLAAILLLFFTSLQTFCSLFSCVRMVFRLRKPMN